MEYLFYRPSDVLCESKRNTEEWKLGFVKTRTLSNTGWAQNPLQSSGVHLCQCKYGGRGGSGSHSPGIDCAVEPEAKNTTTERLGAHSWRGSIAPEQVCNGVLRSF